MLPEWPATLWLVRHGESGGNVARDLAEAQGLDRIAIEAKRDCDVPLSPRGVEQAQALGRWFSQQPPGEQPTVILTSPYLRARHTAEIIREEARLSKAAVDLRRASARARVRHARPAHAARHRARVSGGGGAAQVAGQILSPAAGRRELVRRDPAAAQRRSTRSRASTAGERVLIVCHTVVVLCFRYLLERMDEAQILAIDSQNDVANCSLTTYQLEKNRLELKRFNFVAPLRSQGAPVTTEPDVPVKPK